MARQVGNSRRVVAIIIIACIVIEQRHRSAINIKAVDVACFCLKGAGIFTSLFRVSPITIIKLARRAPADGCESGSYVWRAAAASRQIACC